MEDKFTLRDFLVYFTTGLFLLLVLLRVYDLKLLNYLNISKNDIKENEAVTIFLLLPGLYLLGHFIHGLDLIVFKVGRLLWDSKIKRETARKKVYWFHKLLIFVFNGNRVTGLLNEKGIISKDFWKRASKLQAESKFDKAEYWNLMNDLFKGLTLISAIWTVLNLIEFSFLNFSLSFILYIVFWNRARHMAINFVSATNNTYDII